MRRAIIGFGIFVLACCVALGQAVESNLLFEVASVRPAPPDDGFGMTRVQGGLGSPDPGQVTYRNISLMNLLVRAYPEAYRVNGPGWLDTVRYDVVAKIPPETTQDQFKVMLQNLLAERFGLKAHHETKEFPAYDLIVGKGGPKMRAAANTTAPPGEPSGPRKVGPDGFVQLDRPGMVTLNALTPNGAPIARLTAKAQPISRLVVTLGNALNKPVQDKTGLTGIYDFTLEWAPGGAMAGTPPAGNAPDAEVGAPSITYAIKSLGLTLVQTRAVRDVLVIDHADRIPTVN